MNRLAWVVALVAATATMTGCDDDDDDNVVRDLATVNDLSAAAADLATAADLGGADGGAMARTFNVPLSGAEETPPNASIYTGSATVVVNAARSQIMVMMTHNVPSTTMAHIHVGPPGVAGSIIFNLSTTTVPSPLNVTLTASDLQPRPNEGVATFDDAVTKLLAGQTYINIHSTLYPNGEIRGQID